MCSSHFAALINVCLLTQLCLTLCDHMNCSPPGSSVHGILQARTLESVAISFFRGSSQTRNLHCRQILHHLSHQGSRQYNSAVF